MQTFLPYPDFAASAAALDDLRLGKQRVETMQILRALTRPVYGWKHHPAVLQWQGYEEALAAYGLAICREWCGRGKADTCEATILTDLAVAGVRSPPRTQQQLARLKRGLPSWLGDDAFHRSHRSALVRKNPEFYGPLFPDADPDLDYVWPSKVTQ